MRGRTKAGSFHDRDPTNTAIVIAFYEAFKGGAQDLHEAFQGFRLERDARIAQDDLAVCRITMTGRHVKALGPWQPSGRMVRFHGMDMHRLRDGRIVETWHFERLQSD
ncbi:ester cyclase [Paracoccus yeei]|uniref:ester cyclase n=1 Tax=Paracoccus yeei TaxID=147645 RepID=UPI003BF903C4